MDCNEDDKTSDFFKAFLHSLRSSCFQFIDFRDHVSIRGFLAVDVDGENQQHYVLSEIVSRSKNSGRRSFPLEVVTSSKSLDQDLTSAPEKSPKNFSLSEDTEHRHFNSSRSNMPQNKLSKKTRTSDKSKRPKKYDSPIDGKPPRPYVFQTVRSDPSNSTFIMEQGTRSSNCRQTTSATNDRERGVPKHRISNTTVDVSPRASLLQKKNAVGSGSNNNTSMSKSRKIRNLTHSIRKHDNSFHQSRSTSRKRPHRSSSVSSNSAHCVSVYHNSESSCEDNSAYPERPKRKEQRRKKSRRKRDRVEPSNEISAHSSSRGHGSLRSKVVPEKYPYHQLYACYDSDQDCSITAVKPRYLVGLTDDLNNINITSEGNSVNLLSKSTEAKLKKKLLLTEENILKYHGSPL